MHSNKLDWAADRVNACFIGSISFRLCDVQTQEYVLKMTVYHPDLLQNPQLLIYWRIHWKSGSVFINVVVIMCLFIKVEEVKRRQHCLMFSSAGSQAQTYFVNFDTLAEYQRWHRQASKVRRTLDTYFLSPAVCFLFVPFKFILGPVFSLSDLSEIPWLIGCSYSRLMSDLPVFTSFILFSSILFTVFLGCQH